MSFTENAVVMETHRNGCGTFVRMEVVGKCFILFYCTDSMFTEGNQERLIKSAKCVSGIEIFGKLYLSLFISFNVSVFTEGIRGDRWTALIGT